MMTDNTQPDITFTTAAAVKVKSLIAEEGNFKLNLRVFISGGGCSGFQYGFTFDEKIAVDDQVVISTTQKDDDEDDDEEDDGGEGDGTPVRLLIDPLSYQYLVGATIDYKEDINGAQFVITNPNAKTTCGCGNSFS